MRSAWYRSNVSIGMRVLVFLTLLAAFVISVVDVARPPLTETNVETKVDLATIRLDVSTKKARPGQRIGIRLTANAAAGKDVDVVLLANGSVVEVRPLPVAGNVRFEFDVPASGPLIFGAELRSRSGHELLAGNAAAALVNVATIPAILVVAGHPSAYAESLDLGGWPVTEVQPDALANNPAILKMASMLVLDDISALDLPNSVWERIEHAVRIEGMGLLVLGGPNAFSLGGYRASRLEELLPVISEPPNYEPPASLLFLIDVSGSMDQQAGTGSRLQVAEQAVIETSKVLRPVDRVGLISFDKDFREHLSVEARDNHAEAIEQSWPATASGGTRLLPAMASAILRLEQDTNSHDILIILTDGNVEQADLDEIARVIRSTEVEVIALIVANSDDRNADTLIQMLESSSARAVRIDNVLHLPVLMRTELEKARPAVITEPSELVIAAASGWLQNISFAGVDQYSLTRPRERATVQVVSSHGDAVIASNYIGAGEVIAVTSGFSNWTPDWLQSDDWPVFVAGLTRRLAIRNSNAFDVIVNADRSGNTVLTVEQSERLAAGQIHATLVSPSQTTSALDLKPDAPGRSSIVMQLEEAGQYLVVINDELSSAQYRFLHKPLKNPGNGLSAEPGRIDRSAVWQRWLIVLGLLIFLAALAWERR